MATKQTQGAKVVVVGAGFGGIAAARRLTRLGHHVTLVDRHPYNTFQPLLYQVATGGLNPGDVTYSLRALVGRLPRHRARFRRALLTGIDRERRQVLVDDGPPIDYDHLVLAQGVTTNHFGIPGAAEFTRSMYTRRDAIHVRDIIFGALERLAANPTAKVRGLTILVVGGGPTGVEMAGSLAEMRSVIGDVYPEIERERLHVVLVEMTDHLLGPFDPKLREYTRRELIKRGVVVRTSTAIEEVRADAVTFKGGEEMAADLVIWAAGIGGYPQVADWGLATGRGGRIVVDDRLRVQDEDGIYAIGDAALIDSNPLPQVAPPAMQQGHHVADVIHAVEQGREPGAFEYFDKGTMATIGRSDAVVQLRGGIKLKGLPAWLIWVGLHIYMLLGGRNRLQAMVSLTARYITWPRISSAIVGDLADTPAREEYIARLQAGRGDQAGAAEERQAAAAGDPDQPAGSA